MAKQSKTIWRVRVEDSEYPGEHGTFLLHGDTAAHVESLALKLAAKASGDVKSSKPYIRCIELVGELDN